jgi:hypothetical protein
MTVSTGMETWLNKGQWVWPDQGVRLLKLHGSIDWVWQSRVGGGGQLPREVLMLVENPEPGTPPALVFGQREKLRAQGPFLGLLLRRWLADDGGRRLLVVNPAWPERDEWPAGGFRMELKLHLPSNRLEVWREPCSAALVHLAVEGSTI